MNQVSQRTLLLAGIVLRTQREKPVSKELATKSVAFSYGGVDVLLDDARLVSLTGMWKAAGCPTGKEPATWKRREDAASFIKDLACTLNVRQSHVLKSMRGKGGASWAHWQIAMAYAKHLSHEFHRFVNEAFRQWANEKSSHSVRPEIARPWSERFMATLQPHWQYVNIHYPGCFTIATASIIQIFGLEDQLLRHEFQVSPADRPDGSLGQCWAHYRRKQGMPEASKKAPLYLPNSGYYADLLVYENGERGPFEEWILSTYLPEKMPNYLWKKPSFKIHGELAVASVAENTCQALAGSPIRLMKPKIRKQLAHAGGFCPAGYSPPQLPSPQRRLFD